MWITVLIIAAAGVAVTAAVAGAVMVLGGNSSSAAEARLHTITTGRRDSPELAESFSLTESFKEGEGWLSDLVERMPGLGQYLQQADLKISAARFLSVIGGSFVGGIVITLVAPGIPKLLAPLTGILFATVPIAYVWLKRKRRLTKFGHQMPEALELLSRSLRAGHSLGAGFGLIGTEMQDPVRVEFARCFEEQNLGIPLEEALEDMCQRVPTVDVRFFATAVILQRQTGGDLSEILDKLGHLIRERIQILGQVAALTGEGRLSGIVLLALPPILFIVMMYLNYDYIMLLFRDPLGHKMLGGAIVAQLIGALVIKKIITIKV